MGGAAGAGAAAAAERGAVGAAAAVVGRAWLPRGPRHRRGARDAAPAWAPAVVVIRAAAGGGRLLVARPHVARLGALALAALGPVVRDAVCALAVAHPHRRDGVDRRRVLAVRAAARPPRRRRAAAPLPPSGPALNWTALPGFISAGDDLATLPAGTPLAAAQKACAAMPRCLGYTYHAACGPTVPGNVTIKLKGSLHSGGGADWCRVAKPPKLDGVFLENVETLTSADWSA